MERVLTAGFIFICFGQNLAWAQTENRYFQVGKSLELRPPSVTAAIANIQWRHKEDIAAEWSSDEGIVETYRNFKGRTELNTTSGCLVINDMTEEEAGVYSVEINSRRLDVKYDVKSVEEVPTPKVWARPGPAEDQLIMVCECKVEKAGPVTYWWDTSEDRSWVQLNSEIVITNNETMRRWEKISCEVRNPFGKTRSPPEPNPFFSPEPSSSSLGAALGAIIPILILIGLGVIGYLKRDLIRQCFGPRENAVNTSNSAPNANSTMLPQKDSTDVDNGN